MKLYREVEVKLYKVNACFDMFILADSSEEAEKVAMDNCQEDLDHCYRDAVQVAMSISDKKDVPREWHDSIPWISKRYKGNEETISELFESSHDLGEK